MSKLLRVLIVEDSEIDAFLLVRELEKGGFEALFERVDSAEALSNAIESQTWDLILSDYSMPSFGGAEALSICRQKGVDIPFIVVSGRIGEETAVEMMKAGADDYMMKDQLARLSAAVERELRAAQERQSRRRIEAAVAHLASIVETCDDGIISHALDDTILSWNAGAERLFGFTADEIVGRSITLLMPRDRMAELVDIREVIERGEQTEHIETVRLRKDGKAIDVSLTVSPIKDSEGWIRGASVIARDISQRKQQEHERLVLIEELTQALARVKTLSGLLPICASCKKIRNDNGYWEQVEIYIKNHSDADFTHGICPDCVRRLYPEYHARTVSK